MATSDRTPSELAALRRPRPGESEAYSKARTELLAGEIALQRQIDRLSAQRRALPPGPVIERDYRFVDAHGHEADLAGLFGENDTLVVYFWMYGPQRERPCPMCTNLLGPLAANAADIEQSAALVVVGRSPVERQQAFARERGWQDMKLVQAKGDDFPRDFGGIDPDDGSEWAFMAIFTREGETVRLFWKGEMTPEMADEGKDPRGGVDFAPLWNVLDLTPEGRPATWYPKLAY
jgi:predicted dithiol-disulfide oxidoreductase (DUF899 family)